MFKPIGHIDILLFSLQYKSMGHIAITFENKISMMWFLLCHKKMILDYIN